MSWLFATYMPQLYSLVCPEARHKSASHHCAPVNALVTGGGGRTDAISDYWLETSQEWIRVHVEPRKCAYVPVVTKSGGECSAPDLNFLCEYRLTHTSDGRDIEDSWKEWGGR